MAAAVLFDAARHGRVEILIDLVKENPSVLSEFRIASLGESLLHVATKSGQLNLAHELMKIDPEIAQELNKDGLRALDIAAITGNRGIVRDILSFNRDLCLLKGKDGRTALHYATIKGRIDVINELIQACPDSIEDVTVYGETALHLSVKNHQFDAFTSLVKWAVNLCKESVVNVGDGDGDTVLHLAVSTRQYACVELLLGENGVVTDVNARNSKGLTALDFLHVQDSYDAKISRKLESAGAVRGPGSAAVASNGFTQPFRPKKDLSEHRQDWFNYFKFQKERDSPSNTRNTLLVVAALIATVCFQAGVSPPDGIFGTFPKSENNQSSTQGVARPPPPPPPAYNPALVSGLAGASAILGSHATSFLFLFANSMGLTASTCIIIYLTMGFPFQRELHTALYSMMFTYGFVISMIIKDLDSEKKATAYVLLTVAIVLPFALRWLPRWGKRAWKRWRNGKARNGPLPVDK